tara:strand:- start:4668 stop:5078 length:411 start_codon:yes stop_codon:yes gene_type:complete
MKILGITIAVILLCYFIYNYKNLEAVYVHDIQNNSEVGKEGFEDRGNLAPDVAKNLTTLTNQIDDALLIPKYRKDYETAIIKADSLFELLKLDTLTKFSDIPANNDKKIKEVAEELETYTKVKDGLESLMDFVDGK